MVRHVTRPCPCMTTSIIINTTHVISMWTPSSSLDHSQLSWRWGPNDHWALLRNFSILWWRKKKTDKKTKAFYDWATTGIPVIIALSEHWAIFHLLELYSTNQIPLCQIRLRSISCNFPVNKLHLITYSYRIVQPTEKNQMELNATGSEFFTQFFHVLTFFTNKISLYLLWTLLNLVLIPCKTA